MPTILGFDIGGANIKAATPDGRTWHEPFALWKQPAGLGAVLREMLYRFPDADRLAITMTGELCDCFATKREGVSAILDAVEAVADGRSVHVWGTDGQFHSVERSRQAHLTIAAANWHALASFAGRFAPTHGALLVDTGSTTTDVIPIEHGLPASVGRTDPERLKSSELVYTGVKRTPICAIHHDKMAAEFFATMHDVYVVLGLIAEDSTDTDTADQRPATVEFALARLSRMLGGDPETIAEDELLGFAVSLHQRQVRVIANAIREIRDRPGHEELRAIIVSGAGEFLARRAVREALPDFPEPQIYSLNTRLGEGLSECAPAFAVAVLLAERH